MVMPNFITARELGQYLKLSDSTIYKLATNGQIPGIKIGDSWRFDMDEIEDLVKNCKNATKHRASCSEQK
jgi:excisionase family DNA binding protein